MERRSSESDLFFPIKRRSACLRRPQGFDLGWPWRTARCISAALPAADAGRSCKLTGWCGRSCWSFQFRNKNIHEGTMPSSSELCWRQPPHRRANRLLSSNTPLRPLLAPVCGHVIMCLHSNCAFVCTCISTIQSLHPLCKPVVQSAKALVLGLRVWHKLDARRLPQVDLHPSC